MRCVRLPVTVTCFALLLAGSNAPAATYPPGPTGACIDSVTIAQIQDVLAPCHPALGDTVLGVAGIVTSFDTVPTSFGFHIQNSAGGPFSGLEVFTHIINFKTTMGLEIGDSLVVERSKTAEFQNGTEVYATNNNFVAPNIILRKVSAGNPLPPFYEGTTTTLNRLPTNPVGEQYENCLVRITAAMAVRRTYLENVINRPTNLPTGTFYLVDPNAPGDSVMVEGSTLFTYPPPPVGTPIASVQGILLERTGGYRITLRGLEDIVVSPPVPASRRSWGRVKTFYR